MKEIKEDPDLELQIIATGMHLSPEFGLTYRTIEEDGFPIDEKVEMLLSSDTPVGIAKSIGLGVIGFAEALARLKPDVLILLGDRFEILAAAQAALVARIPIAHIAGGDTTEGAFDEAIRHSITKMAHLHFVTNELSKKRVRQLGENPAFIFNVGNPGLDHIQRLAFLTRSELEQSLDFSFREQNFLITFHPTTLEKESPKTQFQELLSALDLFDEETTGLIFTKPNADTRGRELIAQLDQYTKRKKNSKAFTSLGQLRYLSTLAQVDAVIGNSSSGIYEVPSFKKPTVNIGNRQKGRLSPESVIHCAVNRKVIYAAILEALQKDYSHVINPFGDGNSSVKILNVLKEIPDYQKLIQKKFFEVLP